MTLVWGTPLVSGGAIATAELADLAVDQCELIERALHADRARRLPPRPARDQAVRRERPGARARVAVRRRGRARRRRGLGHGRRDGDPHAAHPQGVRRPSRSTARRSSELFELARWAPNHNLTNPWRFRVLGPRALARAEGGRRARGRGQARPRPDARRRVLRRSAGDPVADEEDLLATGCADLLVLLGAHARGLAAYWRTPAVLREPAGRGALGVGDDERAIALLHLGPARQEQRVPERAPVADIVDFLD